MLNLELQQDTKKQIQKIYKSISLHKLDDIVFKRESIDSIIPGLTDKLLVAYWRGDDVRCDELLDQCERNGVNQQTARVCDVIRQEPPKRPKYSRYNLSDKRRAKYKRKDIPIIIGQYAQNEAECGLETDRQVKCVTRGGTGEKSGDE